MCCRLFCSCRSGDYSPLLVLEGVRGWFVLCAHPADAEPPIVDVDVLGNSLDRMMQFVFVSSFLSCLQMLAYIVGLKC